MSVFLGLIFLQSGTTAERDARWNFIVILTDDQTLDSLPHDPPVMPYLQSRTGDPNDHWIVFRDGFVNTPLCCPSRATLLSGEYAHNHGVLDNDLGFRFDEQRTIATASTRSAADRTCRRDGTGGSARSKAPSPSSTTTTR
jgi:arylsulfatase A-like enzyme